jgi:membrane protease YdiL (CAAX protease family)
MLRREQEKKITAILLALFFASFTAVVSAFTFKFYRQGIAGYAVIVINFAISILVFSFAYVKYGSRITALAVLIYLLFICLTFISRYFGSIALSLLIFSIAIIWNMEIDSNSLRATFKKLGIKSERWVRNAVLGVLSTFFIIYPALLIEALIFIAGGVKEVGVVKVVGELPLYLVVFSFTLAPIFEEVFFRGFLLQKTGIIFSSLLFALVHIGYGSAFELVGAFTVGIVFSLVYRKTNSLITTIFSHATVNFVTAVAVYYFKLKGII